jgi:hypothetical protein
MYASPRILKSVKAWNIITAGAFVLSTSAVAQAQQYVDWTSQTNVAVSGNSLQKTGGCDGCDDAGAVSRQMIRAGDGYAEFTVTDPYSFWVAGLSRAGASPRFNDIDFAFRFNGNGRADVLENGAYQGSGDTEARVGDVFRVGVFNGRVQYTKNGQILYESQRSPSYPLVFETSLGSRGARLSEARMFVGRGGLARNNDRYDRYGNNRDLGDYRDRDGYKLNDDFSRMDRNGDGVISRDEWTGSLRQFNQLDANGNSRLTPREFAYGVDRNNGSLGNYGSVDRNYPIGTSGGVIPINPREQWTDTGIRVQAGDLVSFDADGTIQMRTDANDTATPDGSGRRADKAPLPSMPAGMLIGRVGNSAPIAIGSHRTIRMPASGELYLGVNDDFLKDNSGEYRVQIGFDRRY